MWTVDDLQLGCGGPCDQEPPTAEGRLQVSSVTTKENSADRRSEHSVLRGGVLAIASGRALEFFAPRDSCAVIAPWPIWGC